MRQKEPQIECENSYAIYISRRYVRIVFQGGDQWKVVLFFSWLWISHNSPCLKPMADETRHGKASFQPTKSTPKISRL